jgi:hypothetical protein
VDLLLISNLKFQISNLKSPPGVIPTIDAQCQSSLFVRPAILPAERQGYF